MRAAAWTCCVLAFALGTLVGGCGLTDAFPNGTFSGDIPCTLTVGGGDEAQSEDFESPMTLESGDSGVLLNGTALEVGQSLVFSIPNAELAFEISVAQPLLGGFVLVEFEPRPTLPGISIDGTLRQYFDNHSEPIGTVLEGSLTVTDASGSTPFHVRCDGMLSRE